MKRSYISLFAAGAWVALMANPLVAGNEVSGDQRSGPMIIPFSATSGDEVVYSVDEYLFDDDGNLIGIRGMHMSITQTIDIPLLGIEDWVSTSEAVLDIDFFNGDPYLLKFWTAAPSFEDGEVARLSTTYGFHRVTSETMTEKYITSTVFYVTGPLAGVIRVMVDHVEEPLVDPPPYTSTSTGFLYVPEHVDLEDLKNQGKRFGSLNK